MNKQDLDRIARDKIRTDINSNFFVEAGAGSGKTSVLVDRMVSMVEGGLDISRICAITFTKAAASEFYARFQKKLSESTCENAKNALKDIDLCFMGTIDSFCNMVLSEHPAKAGIPSNATVVTDDEMKTLYRRELSRIRQGQYEKDYPGLQDKYNAQAAAEFLCQPSRNESFSLVIMESWLCGRPVLVNSGCAVTRSFASESDGGLYFGDYFEFEGCTDWFLKNRDKAAVMGENGRRYVRSNFAWDVIVDKYMKFFREVSGDKE